MLIFLLILQTMNAGKTLDLVSIGEFDLDHSSNDHLFVGLNGHRNQILDLSHVLLQIRDPFDSQPMLVTKKFLRAEVLHFMELDLRLKEAHENIPCFLVCKAAVH